MCSVGLRGAAEGARYVACVCTGVFLLAEAGAVSTHRVTTHWEDIPELRASYPGLDLAERTARQMEFNWSENS